MVFNPAGNPHADDRREVALTAAKNPDIAADLWKQHRKRFLCDCHQGEQG